MPPRLQRVLAYLPHRPFDAMRQGALFWCAYQGYSIVRGLADDPGQAGTAFNNGRGIISLERTLHVFVEPAVQGWASSSGLIIDAASWIYLNAQTSVTLGALFFIYMRRNDSFYFVRNMMMVAMGCALVGYILYPT